MALRSTIIAFWLLNTFLHGADFTQNFAPPSDAVINAAKMRFIVFKCNENLCAPALNYLKSLPRQKVQTRTPISMKELVKESIPVYSFESTSMAIRLRENDPSNVDVHYDLAFVDFIENSKLYFLGQVSALRIAELIYPGLIDEQLNQKWKYLHTEAIRVFNMTVRRDDLDTDSKNGDAPVFKLLPHFDVNESSDDYRNPFDATMVIAMEAHGFGKQTMQIGLTPKNNIAAGAVVDERKVFILSETEIGNTVGYLIMQRQLDEDEWVIVHTASPILRKDVTSGAMRCMLVINSRLNENTDATNEYKKLPPLADNINH